MVGGGPATFAKGGEVDTAQTWIKLVGQTSLDSFRTAPSRAVEVPGERRDVVKALVRIAQMVQDGASIVEARRIIETIDGSSYRMNITITVEVKA